MVIEYKKIIDIISKYIPSPQAMELNKWVDSLRKENQELREEINTLQRRIDELSSPPGVSSKDPSCPNCSTSGRDFHMSPIPKHFIKFESATHKCSKCGYKTNM